MCGTPPPLLVPAPVLAGFPLGITDAYVI